MKEIASDDRIVATESELCGDAHIMILGRHLARTTTHEAALMTTAISDAATPRKRRRAVQSEIVQLTNRTLIE